MPRAPFARQNPPVCETCGNTRLQKYGVHNGKQSYHCPPCRHTQTGYPVPPPKPDPHLMPCPKCRGKTRIVRTHGRRHQLYCPACRHHFTDCYLNSPMPRQSEGSFHHRKTFAFCYKSSRALDALCQKTGMSCVQALRHLLHKQRETPLLGISIARVITDPRTGERETRISRIARVPDPESIAPEIPLPNAFPAALRKMRERFREQNRKPFKDGNPPIVGLVSRVNLCMDDRAKQGLLIAMTRYDTDHQNALRQLLIDSHAQNLR